MNDSLQNTDGKIHPTGAPLGPPFVAYALLTVLAVVIPLLIAGEGGWSSPEALSRVHRDHPGAARLGGLLLVAASVPLAVFAAVVSERIRILGLAVPGRIIALVGGTVAAALLAVSGLLSMAMTAPGVAGDLPLLQFGQHLVTALGGPGFAAFTGLLVAGIAVPGLVGGLLPKPLTWTGLVLAVLCELALLTLVTDAAAFLNPVARFGSMVWIVTAVLYLRRARSVTA